MVMLSTVPALTLEQLVASYRVDDAGVHVAFTFSPFS